MLANKEFWNVCKETAYNWGKRAKLQSRWPGKSW